MNEYASNTLKIRTIKTEEEPYVDIAPKVTKRKKVLPSIMTDSVSQDSKVRVTDNWLGTHDLPKLGAINRFSVEVIK